MATLDGAAVDAYNAVRSDSDPTNWAYLKYTGSNSIGVGGTGAGGLNELASHFADNDAGYGYLRVTTGDNESKRAKFVLIAWCPDNAPIMRKAKVSVHKADVKAVFKEFALEVLASDRGDLNEEKITADVIKAGGANYMGQAAK